MANTEDMRIGRSVILTGIIGAALEYYKSFITVSTTFLIGSLYLLREGFVPNGNSFWFLVVGAILLVAAIGLILEIQRQNVVSGNHALRGDFKKAADIDCVKQCLGRIAIISCVLGMLLVVLSGVVGFKGEKMTEENKREDGKGGIERKGSIDFGSAGPIQRPAEKPAEITKPAPAPAPEKPKDKE